MTDPKNRHDQGPPGMLPSGEINTVGPDGKPTHPVQIVTEEGDVLSPEEFDEMAERGDEPDDLSDLGEVESIFGV